MDITHSTPTFQAFLKEELLRRCKKNPKYSLRAFAQALGVSSSFLSKLLNGKRALTSDTLVKLSERLGLNPEQLEGFQAALPGAAWRSRFEFEAIDQDRFKLIADWYHFAILELATIEGFKADPQWIAKALSINVHEASDALSRLLRMNLLKTEGDSTPAPANYSNAESAFSAAAARKLQRQILEKAVTALDEVPITQRDQTALTLAIPSARIPEASRRITRFRREMAKLLQRPGPRDSVYHLSISLYPVTNVAKT